MYCSSMFVFSLVIVVMFLSEKVTGRSQLNSNYEKQQYKRQVDVVDIGNGNYKHNVIGVGPNGNGAGPTQSSRSQPEVQGHRVGSSPPVYNDNPTNPGASSKFQYLGSTIEIGHGYNNHNIVALEPDTTADDTKNNGGTSFLSGSDVFNVGYGLNNRNEILVAGRPIQPIAPVNSNPSYETRTSNGRVFVNGQPIKPVHNGETWSTYQVNGESIQILNTD